MQIDTVYQCRLKHLTDISKQADVLHYNILQSRTELFTKFKEHRSHKIITSINIIKILSVLDGFHLLPKVDLDTFSNINPLFVANLGSISIYSDKEKKDIVIITNGSYNIQVNIS